MSGPLIRLALKLLIWFHEKNDQCYGILDKNVISQKEWIEMLTAGVVNKKKLLFVTPHTTKTLINFNFGGCVWF